MKYHEGQCEKCEHSTLPRLKQKFPTVNHVVFLCFADTGRKLGDCGIVTKRLKAKRRCRYFKAVEGQKVKTFHEKLFYFPLSDEDIDILREGGIVFKNFSPQLRPDILFCVVAWNKTKSHKLDKKRFDGMRRAGISVAHIPLTESKITKIEDGDGFSIFYDGFEVLVLHDESCNLDNEEGKG